MPRFLLRVAALSAAGAWALAPTTTNNNARAKARRAREDFADDDLFVASQLGSENYANLAMQVGMLLDDPRMLAYREAIFNEPLIVNGGTVLDVGAGSGILSMWCAQAGASKVYAVERSGMAEQARQLVEANGLSHIVEVRRCSTEDLLLERHSVDVIVSEWMGTLLLGESMLPSVLSCRDGFLKKDTGRMLPRRAKVYLAPANLTKKRDAKLLEYFERLGDWRVLERTLRKQGLDFGVLRSSFDRETLARKWRSAAQTLVSERSLLSKPALIADLDLETVSVEAARSGLPLAPFDFPGVSPAQVSAFVAWFDVEFGPDDDQVTLSTGPAAPATHWGQIVLYVADLATSSTTKGTFAMTLKQPPGTWFDVAVELEEPDGTSAGPEEEEEDDDDDDDDDDEEDEEDDDESLLLDDDEDEEDDDDLDLLPDDLLEEEGDEADEQEAELKRLIWHLPDN